MAPIDLSKSPKSAEWISSKIIQVSNEYRKIKSILAIISMITLIYVFSIALVFQKETSPVISVVSVINPNHDNSIFYRLLDITHLEGLYSAIVVMLVFCISFIFLINKLVKIRSKLDMLEPVSISDISRTDVDVNFVNFMLYDPEISEYRLKVLSLSRFFTKLEFYNIHEQYVKKLIMDKRIKESIILKSIYGEDI